MLSDSIIHFGENLPEDDLASAYASAHSADLCLALGSSLKVTPASDIPKIVGEKGGLVIVNLQPTPFDDVARLIIRAKVDDVMRIVMAELELEEPDAGAEGAKVAGAGAVSSGLADGAPAPASRPPATGLSSSDAPDGSRRLAAAARGERSAPGPGADPVSLGKSGASATADGGRAARAAKGASAAFPVVVGLVPAVAHAKPAGSGKSGKDEPPQTTGKPSAAPTKPSAAAAGAGAATAAARGSAASVAPARAAAAGRAGARSAFVTARDAVSDLAAEMGAM
jgi:hypothetical protein